MIANRISRAKDVVCRRIDDDIVVIKEDGLSLHVLNKTAAIIWDMCDGKSRIDDITARLCERFEISFKEAREDVRKTLRVLTEMGIIK
jgi:hypothetical protein